MKLPTIKRISKEDLKGSPEWVSALITPLNAFMENVYSTLNKNITLDENIFSFVKEITYRTPSTYPTGVEAVSFINNLKDRATGLMVMQAVDRTTFSPAAGPVYAPWSEYNGNITLGTITGLEADKLYIIRMVIF